MIASSKLPYKSECEDIKVGLMDLGWKIKYIRHCG